MTYVSYILCDTCGEKDYGTGTWRRTAMFPTLEGGHECAGCLDKRAGTIGAQSNPAPSDGSTTSADRT